MSTSSFDAAFDAVRKLSDGFHDNVSLYISPDYSELDVRLGFIDRFFTALGWIVVPDPRTNPMEREVRLGFGVDVGDAHKFADYAFFLRPNFKKPRFFCEAKKPQKDIATPDYCFQTVRYGANGKTPVSILTDFNHFEILDSRFTPDIKTILGRRIQQYRYTDYADQTKFGELYWKFSREAVAAGNLEKFAETLPKRGAQIPPPHLRDVDNAFLDELETFRVKFAQVFKKLNPDLDSETLTETTQRMLDRLVFMRFLEDRLVEPKPIFRKFVGKETAWSDFTTECRRLNSIYNGIVFRNHPLLDSPGFRTDNEMFSGICAKLVDRYTPYDFNTIPVYILGSIYERFLGNVIIATDKRVRVEEKPEVRRAGGVHYTPEYIARCLAENTVGKLIEGKTPDQIAKMAFADISCGSGSILLAVFDLLLVYHSNYYNQNPSKVRTGDCIERDGSRHLSLRKKREILLNNIYGVDIDAQAVEVCQLSLYLKLLKDETTGSANDFQLEFHETLLPSLSKNIVCGNSLVGTDIEDGNLIKLTEEERRTLRPMNFEDAFPEVKQRGWFDAIIGNPPYVRMEAFKPLKAYFKTHYAAHEERTDIYAYFIEKAHKLLSPHGQFGMIVSNKFLRANYGAPLRKFLTENATITRIVDLAGLPVFKGATVRTIILFTSQQAESKKVITYSPPPSLEKFSQIENGLMSVMEAIKETAYPVASSTLARSSWSFPSQDAAELLDKLKASSISLYDYCNGLIGYGIKTGLEDAFVIDAKTYTEILKTNPEAKEILKPYLNGRDVRPYRIGFKDQYLIYTYHGVDMRKYPAVEEHLKPYRVRLQARATKQRWYELQQPQQNYAKHFDSPKIIVPDIATEPRFALDDTGYYGATTIFFIAKHDLYLLALLNSRIGYFYFAQTCAALEGKKDSYLRFKTQYLQGFPVHKVNASDGSDKLRHDAIATKAEAMLVAKKELAAAKTDANRDYYEQRCDALHRQIDALVCELYGLTDEEIKIVNTIAK